MLFNLYFMIGWDANTPSNSSPLEIERAIRWATGWMPNNLLFVAKTLEDHPDFQKAQNLAVGEKMPLGSCYQLERVS